MSTQTSVKTNKPLVTSIYKIDKIACNVMYYSDITGWQWTASGVGFNLNADMALVKVVLLKPSTLDIELISVL